MSKHPDFSIIFMLPVLLLSSILIASCATAENTDSEAIPVTVYESPIDFSVSGYDEYLKTPPRNGSPVFFSSVQRMSNRGEETAAALLNASEQASKYIAVQAISKFYSEKVNASIKYIRDLDVLWDRELALEMIDRLEVLQISQDSYGTYLTAVLPDEEISSIPRQNLPPGTKGGPAWTSIIPDIPGYIVSVGVALQAGYVSDSFAAADNQALEDLARQISVEIYTGKKQVENARGTASLQTNFEISDVIIPGFYILERWRTPDARYYYSLAVTPEAIITKYRND